MAPRDSKNRLSYPPSMGAPSTPREPQSFNLVVCGATNPQDGSIFSDYMGYCMALKEAGVGGDFWSCFPVYDHFVWLRQNHDIDTIKWGKLPPDGQRCVYSYSRWQFANREPWWSAIARHTLADQVRDWIRNKTHQARSGDVVNIILEGHGNRKAGILLGDKRLHYPKLHAAAGHFLKGVQVNMVSGACHSGWLVEQLAHWNQDERYAVAASPKNDPAFSASRSYSNRIRNSRFSFAFVQSLAKVNFPGQPRRKVSVRLEDFENFMNDQLLRNLTPTGKPVPAVFGHTSPIDGMTAIEDLIFRSKTDIDYDPSIGHRRRRIEWPLQDSKVQDLFGQYPNDDIIDARERTKSVIQYHLEYVNWKNDFAADLQIGNEWYSHRERHWRALLRNLYWRARRQSCMYDLFELLASRQLVDVNCLASGMDVKACNAPQMSMVRAMFYCFEFPQAAEDKAQRGEIAKQSMDWDCEQTWLATVISRSGKNLRDIFLTIDHSRMLGPVDEVQLSEWLRSYAPATNQFPSISPNPLDNPKRHHADADGERWDNTFGFILPHDLGQFQPNDLPELLRPFRRHLEDIEAAVIEEFELPEGTIVLESQQQVYFEKNPDKLPGSENDIPDGESTWEQSRAGSATSTE